MERVHVEALDLALQSINQYDRERDSKWVLEADRKTDIFISKHFKLRLVQIWVIPTVPCHFQIVMSFLKLPIFHDFVTTFQRKVAIKYIGQVRILCCNNDPYFPHMAQLVTGQGHLCYCFKCTATFMFTSLKS